MKKTKIFAASLAVCIAMTSLAACNDDSAKETKATTEESQETEVTETTLAEAEEETTATEAEETSAETTETEPEETEPEIDLTLYQEGSFYDFQNSEEDLKWYNMTHELAQQIVEENPDETMYFGVYDDLDFNFYCFYFGNVGWHWDDCEDGEYPFSWYEWSAKNDELRFVDGSDLCDGPAYSFTYEDFMSLPIYPLWEHIGNSGPLEVVDNTPDGEYNCIIRAISLDGTKLLAIVQDPIIISAEEYANIKPGDHISVADNDPRYDYKLDVRDDFSFDEPEKMFRDNILFFQECEDGNYMLVCPLPDGGTETGFYTSYNSRMVFIDIDPECEVIDDFCTSNDDFTPYGFVDGPNAITRSFYFFYQTHYYTHSKPVDVPICNDWIRFSSKNVPIVVKDNAIVKITFD